MRKILLASAALMALLLAVPADAQHRGRHGGDANAPATPPAGAPATPPAGAPALIPGTPLLAPGGGQHGGTAAPTNNRATNGTGRTNRGDRNGRGRTNAGGTNPFGGANNPFSGRGNQATNPPGGRGGHAGRTHNNAFDTFRRAFNAPRHYRHGTYNRPSGWYAHRWNYGEFLPALFFSRNYWITDYDDFDLSDPPDGTVWVRYGNDALLIDEDSGEVIQVVYGIFY
ncbi:MAG: RcnB family protein [Rhizomicrobium sp.]